jgi:hypothetical protein
VSTFFSNRALASAVLALTFHKHAHSRTRGSAGGAGEGAGRGGKGQWGQESARVCAALTQQVTDHNIFYFLGTTERLSKNRKRTGAKLCDSRVEKEEEKEEQGGMGEAILRENKTREGGGQEGKGGGGEGRKGRGQQRGVGSVEPKNHPKNKQKNRNWGALVVAAVGVVVCCVEGVGGAETCKWHYNELHWDLSALTRARPQRDYDVKRDRLPHLYIYV